MNVLPIPEYPWLDRLRPGHKVWLVKEREFATVDFCWTLVKDDIWGSEQLIKIL